MPQNGPQFDPVASAAISAINTSNRTLATLQQDLGAPQLPSQAQVASSASQGIDSISSMSPFNVLANSGLPNLPGMQGQFQLPGMQGQGLPETPSGLPGPSGRSPGPNLNGLLPFGGNGGRQQTTRTGKQTKQKEKNGGSNGGSTKESGSMDARGGRDQSR